MEDRAKKQHIFISHCTEAKSCPCLIVYTKKGKNEAEALEAFVLTPFFLHPILRSAMHIS